MYLELKKEIKIEIRTEQNDAEGLSETNTLCIEGISGQKDGVDVLIYDLEDSTNILLLYNDFVKMIKTGDVQAEMTFDVTKPTTAVFSVAGNCIVFDINTVSCKTMNDDVMLELEYSLASDGKIISEYRMNILEKK